MYKEKMCSICNSPFQPSSPRQRYCNKPIECKCVICGKDFIAKCTKDINKCCSKECSDKYAASQRQSNYTTRKCEWCGGLFQPKSNTQKYCTNVHYAKCEICSKEYAIDLSRQDRRRTCSTECSNKLKFKNGNPFSMPECREKAKQTSMQKYGVEYPSQCQEVKDKQVATNLDRYGVEFYSQKEGFADEVKQTNIDKYGVSWPMQSDKIQHKMKQTCMQRFGVSNPMQNSEVQSKFSESYQQKTGYTSPLQNPEVRKKVASTIISKYGVPYYAMTDEFNEKYRETSLSRFGTTHPLKNDEIKEKMRNTNLAKYGNSCYLASEDGKKAARQRLIDLYGQDHFSKSKLWKERRLKSYSNIELWTKFTEDPVSFISLEYNNSKPSYDQLSERLGVLPSNLYDFMLRRDLRSLMMPSLSYMENQVTSLLTTLSCTYEVHNRRIISPNELDIVLADSDIAIECNPTATHNSTLPYMDIEGNITPVSYHKSKTDRCEQRNIFLFHIFGYEWTHKRPIIESMIRNLLGKNDNKIYARKCELKEVSGHEAYIFLEENHRQGGVHSKVRLGLYYQDELVSLMTFGKMRQTIGTGNDNTDDCYELVRFCNKLNTSVVGGASKLFKRFVKDYQPRRIRSFSDRAHTRGQLYANLGFAEVRRSDPGYVWVDVSTDIAYNRVNAQKQNINKFLEDDEIDLTKSEKQIMEEHGFVQVFDSGTITWEWSSDSLY